MKADFYFITVIIPTYHDWERLQLCLNALVNQTYSRDYFEIIVVNNAPENIAPAGLVIPSNCVILDESKPGSYAARNKALSVAKGEIFAFTDSDCQPKNDWLEVAVNFFSKNPSYDRIGGNITLFSDNKKPNWFEIYEMVFVFAQEEYVIKSGMAATGNMMSKKHVFDNIGWFNSDLMSGGDGEWGKRAYASKHAIKYVKECIVLHPTRDEYTDITTKNERVSGGHLYLARKQGKLNVLKLIIKSFLPPINAIIRAHRMTDQSFKHKSIAIGVCYYLKILSALEIMKLLILKKKVERV